eukprot:TRINITY_DN90903_c0_g1_i1.p1 TRINITY_DN90903_c0_g1~~TRINITY_DN90903_c0_g1_i1.p1  ORF type:complete len:531 (+),score=102.08 TRINITY_DN90903_c0_g1_i1:47-1594(+)
MASFTSSCRTPGWRVAHADVVPVAGDTSGHYTRAAPSRALAHAPDSKKRTLETQPVASSCLAYGVAAGTLALLCPKLGRWKQLGSRRRQRHSLRALRRGESERLFAEAQTLMPGGVNSPIRAFKSVDSQPVVIDRVKGAYVWDVDGNKYVDFVLSYGPAVLGHADDEVLKVIRQQLGNGTSFGAPSVKENELAQLIIDAIPSVEMVRFTNSGTEACMGALRLARAYTKRMTVVKFEGSYHGFADALLVNATRGAPQSAGLTPSVVADTMCAQYNNLDSVEAILREHDVAAVMLEGVMGNCGFVPPTQEFLAGLRELTQRYGALLIFDEVMTGFRISYGGAQDYFGVTPDLTCLGKVIGGGLPVGAYAGRKDVMEMVAPAGPMYQAGTLSGNPLAMVAGAETLRQLQADGVYQHLDKLSRRLLNGLVSAGQEAGHEVCGAQINGMFGFYFSAGPVTCFADAAKSDVKKFARWHKLMLERGVYLPPSQFESLFVSLAHTEDDIDFTLAAAREVFAQL